MVALIQTQQILQRWKTMAANRITSKLIKLKTVMFKRTSTKLKKFKNRKNEKGMAVFEAIPVLFITVLVFNFSLGFFGAIHSGILNSIGSYNYTIETFRFKSNLMYFRPGNAGVFYKKAMNRVHGTVQDGGESDSSRQTDIWPATIRGVTFNYDSKPIQLKNGQNEADRKYASTPTGNNVWRASSTYVPDQGGEPIQTPRIWIKTVYGICLNAECRESN